ncbi:MAG: PspC domain-containing protein [Candidatus Solibacter sp.]
MYCTQCGLETRVDDRFCSRCGKRTGIGHMGTTHSRPLMLDKRNKKVAGVCAGFARYMDADVILVRTVWLVVALATGVGFIAYLAAWMIMPSDYGYVAQSTFVPGPQPT